MAFGDFKYPAVLTDLGLTLRPAEDLFADVPPVPVGEATRQVMALTSRLGTAIHSEKARSEWMVAPLLGQFWAGFHATGSGSVWNRILRGRPLKHQRPGRIGA